MMLKAEQKEALIGILGDTGFVENRADKAAYENGARYDNGAALFVARPQNTEQVSKLLAYCLAEEICLVPQSGNTGLVSASTPDGTGAQAVLSLDRMNQIADLDVYNRSIHVGAGVKLSALNDVLEKDGMFFPIDLGADPCIGGMVATNTGGTRFVRYGDVRQNLLGLKIVLVDAEGTVLDFTNPIRKNNTGPDWKQMFVGTSGVFGVITECVLNVVPNPKQSSSVLLVPTKFEAVNSLLVNMERLFGSSFTAFEGMSKNAVEAAFDHVPSLSNPFPGGKVPEYVILAEVSRDWEPIEGELPLDDMLENALASIWEKDDEPLADAFMGRSDNMWAIRHALSEGVKNLGQLIAFDVSFRRGDVMAFTAYMAKALPEKFPDVKICDFGHIGDGGLHFNLVVPNDDTYLTSVEFERELRDWVYSITIEKFDGSFSAEHAVGPKNQRYYDLYTPNSVKKLAAAFMANASVLQLGNTHFS